jgi:ABC-type branched-subunit amino acid transport system permease subunit
MEGTILTANSQTRTVGDWIRANAGLLISLAVLVALPFIVAIIDGQPIGDMLANEDGRSKFIQSLVIEIFILAIYAISYDLILGITGILSFGHAMFFAAGAYATGIALKNLNCFEEPGIGSGGHLFISGGGYWPGQRPFILHRFTPRPGDHLRPGNSGFCLGLPHNYPVE